MTCSIWPEVLMFLSPSPHTLIYKCCEELYLPEHNTVAVTFSWWQYLPDTMSACLQGPQVDFLPVSYQKCLKLPGGLLISVYLQSGFGVMSISWGHSTPTHLAFIHWDYFWYLFVCFVSLQVNNHTITQCFRICLSTLNVLCENRTLN